MEDLFIPPNLESSDNLPNMTFTINKSKQYSNGFTIAELLVSMVITLVIVGILTFVTAKSFDVLADGRGNIKAQQDSQIALNTLQKDLEGLVYQRGNDFDWLAASSEDVANGSSNVNAAYTRLAFLTVAQDRDTSLSGDVCCVEYGIFYKDPTFDSSGAGQKDTYVLYRRLVEAPDTFVNHIGQVDLLSTLTSSINTANNLVCSNIKEFSITVELVNTLADGTVTIKKLPIAQTSNSDNALTSMSLKGNAVVLNPDDVLEANSSVNIRSFEINAQILDEEVIPLLSLPSSDEIKEKIEQGITRFSKKVFIPQIN